MALPNKINMSPLYFPPEQSQPVLRDAYQIGNNHIFNSMRMLWDTETFEDVVKDIWSRFKFRRSFDSESIWILNGAFEILNGSRRNPLDLIFDFAILTDRPLYDSFGQRRPANYQFSEREILKETLHVLQMWSEPLRYYLSFKAGFSYRPLRAREHFRGAGILTQLGHDYGQSLVAAALNLDVSETYQITTYETLVLLIQSLGRTSRLLDRNGFITETEIAPLTESIASESWVPRFQRLDPVFDETNYLYWEVRVSAFLSNILAERQSNRQVQPVELRTSNTTQIQRVGLLADFYHDFFDVTCAVIEVDPEALGKLRRIITLFGQHALDMTEEELIRIQNGTKKEICDWLSSKQEERSANCVNREDPFTLEAIYDVPALFLHKHTTSNGLQQCFDVIHLYRHITQNTKNPLTNEEFSPSDKERIRQHYTTLEHVMVDVLGVI